MADPPPTKTPEGPDLMDISFFLLILMIFIGLQMFFALRRQRKAVRATIDLHESLAIGDRVHTTAGIEGTIHRITDENVDLEIAPGIITTWKKMAVGDKIHPAVDTDEDTYFEDTHFEGADSPRITGTGEGDASPNPERL
jgi:preprotein translocase subunit YajC